MADSRTVLTAPGRLVFGLMTFTVVFALVGSEIANAQGKPSQPGQPGYGVSLVPVNAAGVAGSVSPFMVIFGGTIATSALVLLTHAGEAGEQFAVGLALIAFVSSALIWGSPVFGAANKAFGSKPTTPIAGTTPTTSPTATASALSAATVPALGG